MLNDEELASLLKDIESDHVERKASATERDRICQAICAFANDLPDHKKPGVVFVGANDDGTCSNLSITDELLRNLADIRSSGNILAFPVMSVEKRSIAGCTMAVVIVEPSQNPPIRYNGRVWIRVGPRRAQATAEEESRLAERRKAGDLPFDQQPVKDSSMDDLDLELFTTAYLPGAIAWEVLERNQRTTAQQLRSLHFLTREGVPNVAAILVVGKDPQQWCPGAYVQFVRFDGGLLTDPIRSEKQLTGTLAAMLRELDEVLEANISVAITVKGGVTATQQPDYPIVALQQLTRNAVIHRTYQNTNAPVRVYWFSDRIEIHNPGGLYGQVTPENFGTGATDYRNPLIAEAMKSLGFVQRFGMGLPLANRELEKNGNHQAQFEFQPNAVLTIIRPAQ